MHVIQFCCRDTVLFTGGYKGKESVTNRNIGRRSLKSTACAAETFLQEGFCWPHKTVLRRRP